MRGEVHPLSTCLCVPSESRSRQTGAGCDISQELSSLRDFHLLSLKLQPEVLGAGTPGGVGFVPAFRSASCTGPGDRAKYFLLGWSAQPWCMRSSMGWHPQTSMGASAPLKLSCRLQVVLTALSGVGQPLWHSD